METPDLDSAVRRPAPLVAAPVVVSVLCMVIWGASPVATRIATEDLEPLVVAVLRTVLAGLVAVPLVSAVGLRPPAAPRSRLLLAVSAGSAFVVFPVVYTIGQERTSAMHGVAILAGLPVLTGLWAAAVTRRLPGGRWLAGCAIALAGEAVIIAVRTGGDGGDATLAGDVLVLGAALAVSSGYVAGARLVPRGVSSQAATYWGVILGAVVLAPLGVGLFAGGDVPHADARSWVAVVFLAVMVSIVGYVGWYWALARGGIMRMAPLMFLQPISGLLLAALILDERLTWALAVGAAFVLGGVAVARREVSGRPYASGVPELPPRALVLGLARSGRAAAAALRAQGVEVVAHDASEAVDAAGLDADVRLGAWDDALLDGVALVVKSPGVPGSAPPVVAARGRGVPVISEIELGARLLPNPLAGVTGTNGKTTTTALLGAIFDAAGRRAEVAGNIGRPLTSLVGAVDDDAWVVCELSSFQLEDVDTLRPSVAVLTNLEPDHIDRHGTFDDYAAAKLRAFEQQAPDDVAVVPRGFGPLPGAARRVEFAAGDPLPAEPRIPGAHNRENAAAATAAARAIGLPDAAIARALETFPGVEHRIEEVATIGGVLFVNDSKATNAAAALRALESFPGRRKHVILGGRGKGESYAALAGALASGDRAYLIGEAAPEFAAALSGAGVPYELAGTLERGLGAAAQAAAPGDVVLLAPACASFDQFESFEHRGQEFRRLVQKLPGWGRDDARTEVRSSSDC